MKFLCEKVIKLSRNNRPYSVKSPNVPWNVLFFGTDKFSLYSLESLNRERMNGSILNGIEIVTTCKGKSNPVKKYAVQNELVIHSWPFTVPKNVYDVGLVVSFGHLIPESVIARFPLGMLNVHASLLPRWRGAAPIIYALANGDSETGVTVMRIKPDHFDIGDIVMQKKISISQDTQMPQLHKELGHLGADCLISTLRNLPNLLENAVPQPNTGVTFAPKIMPEFAVVDWNSMTSNQVYNLYRSLKGLQSPTTSWSGLQMKLTDLEDCGHCGVLEDCEMSPGYVKYDKTNRTLIVTCASHSHIRVRQVQVHGRKVMSATDFNNGFVMKELASKRYFKYIDCISYLRTCFSTTL
ncbi:unnamed protein product [Phaedon cochleariae]|uniref:Methionyl-tRNA formyltransferase, mitochondrial n=1 Tax=Phaedon cochleariae TaxID=80249 RepID=A0A9P0GUT7_PHACE|nr:unnamed protein product [Phaedon cochleariae]